MKGKEKEGTTEGTKGGNERKKKGKRSRGEKHYHDIESL